MSEKAPIYICRCQEVTEEEIIQAIKDGATTVQGIKARTEAAMGLCQGRTCRRLIDKLISQYTKPAELKPSVRPPVRTIKVDEIISEEKG